MLLLATFLAASAPLAAQDGWLPTGDLNVGRYGHTATLLPNGKVLVAGGRGTGGIFSSAELYDPVSGTWSITGSLAFARAYHTATLLPNGKVLVAGGEGAPNPPQAELYEPATGLWTTTGSLATARSSSTATLLPSGQVLVAGGASCTTCFFYSAVYSSAEVFDPPLGTWTATGSLEAERTEYTATLLLDGKVLAAGGAGAAPQSAELYDPVAHTWTATGSLGTRRSNHTATLLPNGKVLAAGGGGPAPQSAELYDPVAHTWLATGSLGTARSAHTATLLPSGKVLAAGGSTAGSSTEIYDPVSGTWVATGSLNTARYFHTATLLQDGRVLVAGGSGPTSSAELYGPLPVADLTITKTDGQTTASPGQMIIYTITGTNAGPTNVIGAIVTDTVPVSLTGASWTCVPTGGATCTAGPVAGNINDTVNLPAGGTVTYTLTGQLLPNPQSLSNTATITLPSGMYDPNLADNTATDTDLLVCGNDEVVVPDGRLTASAIAAGATQWFLAQLKIGDSYSLELKNLQLDAPVSSVPPGTLTVFSGDDGCSNTSTVATTDTTPADPGSGASVRVSFTAAGTSPFFRARLTNGSPDSIAYSVGWADTAMYSPTWSTNDGFDTYYSVENTTGAALNGVLMLFESSGAVAGTATLTIPAGRKASANTAALGILRNRTGRARLTHDGPPGAVIVEAAVANFSLSAPYVQPVKFQSTREAR